MFKKLALLVLGLIVVTLGGGLAYLTLKKPAMQPASTRDVPRTPERLARGKSLFDAVSNCADSPSHSPAQHHAQPEPPCR